MLNANMGQQMGFICLDMLQMAAHVVHVAAQRLLLGALGAAHGWVAYGCSEAAFGCRRVAFGCTGAVYGSHVADMQPMLHLAGPGWAARILRPCQVEGNWMIWSP